VKLKLTEEIFLVRNIFSDPREFSYELNTEEKAEEEYVKTKRVIKNTDALRKLNNLEMSEKIYQ
jgi:hypothetical protein